jgi:hypothetical protein
VWAHGGYWGVDKRAADLATIEPAWETIVASWAAALPALFSRPRVVELGRRLRASARPLSRLLYVPPWL